MKHKALRIPVLILTLMILLAPVILAGKGPVPGHAILKLRQGARPEMVLQGSDARLMDSIPDRHLYLISFAETIPIDTIINVLDADSDVVSVQAENTFELPETFQISQGFPDQNEPIFIMGVSPVEYYEQAGVYSVGIDSANLISTGENTLVAVIDNGIDLLHPLFADRLSAHGYDFVDEDSDPSEEVGERYGHGTFVSGLVVLTAPDCMVLPLRAFNESGVGQEFDIIEAIYSAIDEKANVINMSFGTTSASDVLAGAVSEAAAAGIVMVAPSGNEISGEPAYPAAYAGVIAVSSIDTNEVIASFSNYGPWVDLCAPGVALYSALPGEYQWGYWSGTSFSAPLVSGTAALVLAMPPSLIPDDMEAHLKASARTELLWGSVLPPDIYYGFGVLDAYRAVNSISRGDVDGSGTVDVADVGIVIDHVAHRPEAGTMRTGTAAVLGDVNCDGRVNGADIVLMVRALYGEDVPSWHDGKFGPCY